MTVEVKLSEKYDSTKGDHNSMIVTWFHYFFKTAIVALPILLIISSLVAQNVPLTSNEKSRIDSITSAVQNSSSRLSQDSSLSLQKEILKTIENQTASIQSSKYLYLLSAAAQVLAAIMALVFTVTFVVAQLTTRYGMHMAARTLRPRKLIWIFLFIALPIFPLFALLIGESWTAFLSIPFTLTCIVGLVIYLGTLKRELQITVVVDELRKKATKEIRSGKIADVTRVVQEIEDIAYGAISQTDFSTLRSTAGALVCIKEESFIRSHFDFEEDIDRRLRQLCCESARSPRGTAATLQGTIEAINNTDRGPLSRLATVITNMLEGSLRSCEWPLREEIFTSSYYQLRDLFYKLANAKPTDIAIITKKVNEICEQIVSVLKEAISSVNPGANVKVYGSGQALNTLISSFLHGVKSCRDRNNEMITPLNAFMFGALEVMTLQSRVRTQYATESVRMITDSLEASKELLDDNVIVDRLRRLPVDYDYQPILATDQWQQMVFSFVINKKPNLANVAFDKFNILIKTDKIGLRDALMRIQNFTTRSDELLDFHEGSLTESLRTCLFILLERWRLLRTDTDWVMKLYKESTESLFQKKVGLWFLEKLTPLSDGILVALIDNPSGAENIKDLIIYDWIIINALSYSYFNTLIPPNQKPEAIASIRRTANDKRPSLEPVARKIRVEALKKEPKYWKEINSFLTFFSLY